MAQKYEEIPIDSTKHFNITLGPGKTKKYQTTSLAFSTAERVGVGFFFIDERGDTLTIDFIEDAIDETSVKGILVSNGQVLQLVEVRFTISIDPSRMPGPIHLDKVLLFVLFVDNTGNFAGGTIRRNMSLTITEGGDTTPSQVFLSSPPDQATGQEKSLSLRWQSAPSAASYQLQVGLDEGLDEIKIDISNIQETQYAVSGLKYDTDYFWRVRAKDSQGNQGPWSPIWQFSTTTAPLAAPILVEPSDGSVDLDPTVTLQWEAIQNATRYQLQVAGDDNFSTTVFDKEDIATPSRTLTNLEENAEYYWRVRAINSSDRSNWSPTWSFTTKAVLPDAATLFRPENQATDQPVDLDIRWNASANADAYTLQIGLDAQLTDLVLEQENITSTTYSVSGLEYETKYFWRIRSQNESGLGHWSPTWFFWTTEGPSAVNPLEAYGFDLGMPFPNPAGESIQLELEATRAHSLEWSLENLAGQTLKTKRFEAAPGKQLLPIDLSHLPSGIYVVRVAGGGIVVRKVIKR